MSFEPLKAWIAQKEDYERRFGQPAPLTDNERLALVVLTAAPVALVAKQSPRPEADLANVDCVSLLMRYYAAKRNACGPPTFTDECVEKNNVKQKSWQCRCTLPEEAPNRVFPSRDEADPDNLQFSKKKDAKKHAARCAVEWLMGHGYMPTDGVSVTFSAALQARIPTAANLSYGDIGPPGPSSSNSVVRSKDTAAPTDEPAPGLPLSSSSRGVLPPSPPAKPSTSVSVSVPRNNSAAPLAQPLPQRLPPSPPAPPHTVSVPPAMSIVSLASMYSAAAPVSTTVPAVSAVPAVPAVPAVLVVPAGTAGPAAATGTKRTTEPLSAATISKRNRRQSGNNNNNGGDSNKESLSETEQLAKFCELFGLGTPQYTLQSGLVDNLYSGHVTLPVSAKQAKKNGLRTQWDGTDGDGAGGGLVIPLPDGVGVVSNIYTKRAAKERMAQSVLQYWRSKESNPIQLTEAKS